MYGVYLNSSRVVFHFKAGNRSYTVQTNASSYTNGRWYRVRVIRELTNASLTVRPVGPTDSGAVDHNTILIPGPLFLAGGLSILFGGQDPNRFVRTFIRAIVRNRVPYLSDEEEWVWCVVLMCSVCHKSNMYVQ